MPRIAAAVRAEPDQFLTDTHTHTYARLWKQSFGAYRPGYVSTYFMTKLL